MITHCCLSFATVLLCSNLPPFKHDWAGEIFFRQGRDSIPGPPATQKLKSVKDHSAEGFIVYLKNLSFSLLSDWSQKAKATDLNTRSPSTNDYDYDYSYYNYNYSYNIYNYNNFANSDMMSTSDTFFLNNNITAKQKLTNLFFCFFPS